MVQVHSVCDSNCLNYFHRNNSNIPRICVATASVAKFQEAVKAAGLPVSDDARVAALERMETKYEDFEKGEDWIEKLRAKIISVNSR